MTPESRKQVPAQEDTPQPEGPLSYPSLLPYYSLDIDLRLCFLAGFEGLAQYIPSEADLFAMRRGVIKEEVIEEKYTHAADDLAFSLDHQFDPRSRDNDEKTVQLRNKFYKMIRPLSREKLRQGAEEITRNHLEFLRQTRNKKNL